MKNIKFKSSRLLKTPVLFLVFNRPDTTSKVFEKIRQAKPQRLYVASDGPRIGNDVDKEKVIMTRDIATKVDWPCEIKTLFREKNLGCKKACSTAINWFFEYEEMGIILEDDTLPHLDFFTFCENLLVRYANDEKITAIIGTNFQNGKWRGDSSYYFSKFAHVWGWATWKRSWVHYQLDIPFWPEWRESNAWLNYKSDKVERKYWKNIFDRIYAGEIDTWCYSWDACNWYRNVVAATPNVNLISNIGFGQNSTHTKSTDSEFSNMPINKLGPITHPKKILRNLEADRWTFNHHYGGKNLRFPYNWINFPNRVIRYILKRLKEFLK
jgi:hypothetical protein